jgi:Fungal specific transcription factor domain
MNICLDALPNRVLPAPEYKQQLLNLFISCHIPFHMLNGSRTARGKIWLLLLPEMPTLTVALETSILAVCTARIGRLNADQVLLQEGLRLYTRGLCELQKALWNPKLMYREETLAACMALTMYELQECPAKSGGGYVTHNAGAMKLIQLRGAGAHTEGLAHLIFLAFRLHGVGDFYCVSQN